MGATDEIAPPPGFVEDFTEPPAGFVIDPPAGFVEDKPISADGATTRSETERGSLPVSPVIEAPPADPVPVNRSFTGALMQGIDQPIEAMGVTAEVLGADRLGAGLRNLTSAPANYESAAKRFMEPQAGDFTVAWFAPAQVPRAIVEQLGQAAGSLISRVAGKFIGGAVGGATGAAPGAAIGQFAGPFVFGALQIAGPTALERAKRNGRTEPNGEDIAAGIATAAVSGSLDALGAQYLPGGKKLVGSFAKRLAQSFYGEAVTEGLQSGVEQAGQSAGTDAGLELSVKQMAGEAALGGFTSTAMTGTMEPLLGAAAAQAEAVGANKVAEATRATSAVSGQITEAELLPEPAYEKAPAQDQPGVPESQSRSADLPPGRTELLPANRERPESAVETGAAVPATATPEVTNEVLPDGALRSSAAVPVTPEVTPVTPEVTPPDYAAEAERVLDQSVRKEATAPVEPTPEERAAVLKAAAEVAVTTRAEMGENAALNLDEVMDKAGIPPERARGIAAAMLGSKDIDFLSERDWSNMEPRARAYAVVGDKGVVLARARFGDVAPTVEAKSPAQMTEHEWDMEVEKVKRGRNRGSKKSREAAKLELNRLLGGLPEIQTDSLLRRDTTHSDVVRALQPPAAAPDFLNRNQGKDATEVAQRAARAAGVPEQDVGDVANAALAKAFAKSGQFDPEKGNAEQWLSGIVRNEANTRFSAAQKQPESMNAPRPGTEQPLAETVAAEGRSPDQEAMRAEMEAIAAEAVKGLPKGEQAVMTLAMQGKTNPEIAKETGMTMESVGTIKSRAFKKIQKSVYALGISPDNKFAKWLADNGRRLFTAEGDLPIETFQRWVQRTGEVKSESRQIAYATRDLYAGLRKEFGITKADEFKGGLEKVPRAFVERMNRALLGGDINAMPESVREPLQRMRDHIDALSQKMLDDGIVPERLETVVADNLGVYMTRSYRVFDDPKWAESIPVEVRNKARDFILSDLQRTNPAATSAEANAVMQAMLQDWKDQGSGVLIKGGKLGSKDLTSFIARKDIPKVLRDLMGEYKNPVINYARSVTKMAHLIANQQFLNDVRAQGMGKFLFEDGKQPDTHTALIAADESAVMSPLNGLRTTPEIARAFKEFGKSPASTSAIARAYFALSGIAKAGKTVGSVMTQARNLFGQTYFWLMNGHFDPRSTGVAVKSILANVGLSDDKTFRTTYDRYLKLGVVDQSTRASELRDVIRDAGLNDADVNRLDTQGHILKSLKRYTLDAATTAYQVSDDLGKIVGFENELARLKKINPGKPMAELETEAAQRIRNTYPTYSMVPAWVRGFRRQPVVGPFVSFAYESFRTAYHNLRYTAEDLRSVNPEAKKAGAQRLAGQLAVLAGGYALSTMSRAMLGLTADDEDDLRRFMPTWDKNAQLMFTGKKDGKSTYVNLSYANPYSYLTDPINAVISGVKRDEDLLPIMAKSFGELLRPFMSPDIITKYVVDVARNQTENGRHVWNPQDTPDEKIAKVLAHVGEGLEPGTLTRLRKKIIPSILGQQTGYGTALSPVNEIASELTGFKTQTLDYEQALAYKASRFRVNNMDAEDIFRTVATRRGTVSDSDLVNAYKRANEAKFALWKELYGDAQAARRRGVNDSHLRETLTAGGVSKKDTALILAGKFDPYVLGTEPAEKMKRLNRTLPSGVSTEKQRLSGLVLSGSYQP